MKDQSGLFSISIIFWVTLAARFPSGSMNYAREAVHVGMREDNKELRRGSFSPDSEDTTAGRHLLLCVYIWFRLPQTPAQLPSKAFQGERRAVGVSLASHICISFRNP